jgi:uncharacterized membrane protein/uncharacterized protein YegL
MWFLNLTAVEFAVLLGVLGGLITALYLLGREKQKRTVSTLRFWRGNSGTEPQARPHRLSEPWSLILQFIALALLLLAIAQLQFGRTHAVHDHVLIVDNSAWTAERTAGGTLLDKEKNAARRWMASIPSGDRILLVRADERPLPLTPFSSDRRTSRAALANIHTSSSALDISAALQLAQRAQAAEWVNPGSVVYIGPGLVKEASNGRIRLHNLRVIDVRADPHDAGIRELSVREGQDPGLWQATVSVANYGPTPVRTSLHSRFGATAFVPRPVILMPRQQTSVEVEFTTNAAGMFTAELTPGDDLPTDDRAQVWLPKRGEVRVAIYSDRPESIAALFASKPRVRIIIRSPLQNDAPPPADLAVFDHCAPLPRVPVPSLWIDPPEDRSPAPVTKRLSDATVTEWNSDARFPIRLQSKDFRAGPSEVFEIFPGDIPFAQVNSAVIAFVRPETAERRAFAVIGFDPLSPDARFQVTTPLLIADLFSWLAPDAFRLADVEARVPDVAGIRWTPPAETHHSVSAAPGTFAPVHDFWRILAVLAALVLALEWRIYGRHSSPRRAGSLLKLATAGVIVLALADPSFTIPRTRVGTVVVTDTSASVPKADLQEASALIEHATDHKGVNSLRVISFAHSSRAIPRRKEWLIQSAAGSEGMATNIESALRDGLTALPEGYVPRLLLISDGNENEGNFRHALAGLRELRIPVDVVPLAGRPANSIRLDSISIPARAYAGEQIPIDLAIATTAAAEGRVAISANGNEISSTPVHLNAGVTIAHVHARVKSAGATSINGEISSTVGTARFQEAIELRPARVLYVSEDPPNAASNLLSALAQAGFQVSRDARLLDRDLSNIQIVILNNTDLNAFTEREKYNLQTFVQNGGGLLLIGGERQQYKDDAQADALDRILPAKIAPPETLRGTTVALVIDKSSSMEGRKIELARLSAIGVVEHLKPADSIGVLIFDNSFQWAVPMRSAIDKALIKRLIAGITPDGGTQIAPALAEAYRRVLPAKSAFKHIVLLTDGISEEGDSIDLAHEAARHQVTISTVGLGQDVNRSYLEKIAAVSGGRSYFLNQPQGLQQILLKDVQDYTGSTAVEKPLKPIVDHRKEILDGIDMATAPPLKGYARYTAKTGAERILSIDEQKRDPLFVRWQYGLGRSAVFTSDAKSRWAEQWMTWPGFDKFWINVARDLLPRTERTETSVRYDHASGDVLVTYRQSSDAAEPKGVPAVFALGPGNFRQRLSMRQVQTRLYEGQVHIGELTGFFRIRPAIDNEAFPEIGFHRSEPELSDAGNNEAVLKEIAAQTGGRFNPNLAELFDAGGRRLYRQWHYWPGLLGLAIAFTLAELLARKAGAITRLLNRTRTLQAALR